MQIENIKSTLINIIKNTLDIIVIAGDVKRPITRASAKIDILPYSISAACAGARDVSLDIDIYYYPLNADRPLAECQLVAQKLADALSDGFEVQNAWLMPDDELSFEFSNEALACQFTTSYVETIAETGELMENLIFNGEEMTDGNNNAPN